MTVSSTTNKVIVNGNGTATSFSFSPLLVFDSDNLVVVLTDSTGVQTVLAEGTGATNYAVTPASNSTPFTGSITYPANVSGTKLPTGSSLTMRSVIPLTQETALDNQGGYFPEVQETAFDKLTLIAQQLNEQLTRAVKVNVADADAPLDLPLAGLRANMLLGFDGDGNPTAVASAGDASVSSAMVPVVDAATLALARTAMGLGSVVTQDADALTGLAITDSAVADSTASGLTITNSNVLTNTRLGKSATYTVTNNDKGRTLALSGGFVTLTFGDPSGYDANFICMLVNEDGWTSQGDGTQGRAKNIQLAGTNTYGFRLWPGQTAIAFINNGSWSFCPGVSQSQYSGTRWKSPGQVTVYVDEANGLDTNDGMASGAGNALKTIAAAMNVMYKDLDHNNFQNKIKLADGGYSESIQLFGCPVGSNVVFIEGNTTTPANVSWTCPAASVSLFMGDGATCEISGFTLATAGSGSIALQLHQTSICDILDGIVFAPFAGGYHIFMDHGGASMNADVGYTVTGGADVHVHAGPGCFYNLGGTVTLTGTPAFPIIFEGSGPGAAINLSPAASFSGSATGQKYNLDWLAGMNAGGVTLPGNTDGTVGTAGAVFKA